MNNKHSKCWEKGCQNQNLNCEIKGCGLTNEAFKPASPSTHSVDVNGASGGFGSSITTTTTAKKKVPNPMHTDQHGMRLPTAPAGWPFGKEPPPPMPPIEDAPF